MSKWSDTVLKSSLGPINVGLTSASESTMISLLGKPDVHKNDDCYNDKATPGTKKILGQSKVGRIKFEGIKPAVDSLTTIFTNIQAYDTTLFAALGSAGMLCVRLRRPTSGALSTHLSNHSWGTASDISVDGKVVGNGKVKVQRGIAAIIPFFNKAGWFSGLGFGAEDDMHFEVSNETMHAWAASGLLG